MNVAWPRLDTSHDAHSQLYLKNECVHCMAQNYTWESSLLLIWFIIIILKGLQRYVLYTYICSNGREKKRWRFAATAHDTQTDVSIYVTRLRNPSLFLPSTRCRTTMQYRRPWTYHSDKSGWVLWEMDTLNPNMQRYRFRTLCAHQSCRRLRRRHQKMPFTRKRERVAWIS